MFFSNIALAPSFDGFKFIEVKSIKVSGNEVKVLTDDEILTYYSNEVNPTFFCVHNVLNLSTLKFISKEAYKC